MYDLWTQVYEQLRGMWRYRWRALLISWMIALAGWAWVYTLPNIYSASARVYVDTESALKPLLKGLAIESNVKSQVDMMTRALMSTPNLEKVARETDLDLKANSAREMERLVEGLRRRITLSGGGRSNIYTISYVDTGRALAQAVVQTLLSTFVEDSLGANRSDSNTAQRFLQEQIREYETRLNQAEQRLADFKKEHVGMMPGAEGDYYARLQTAEGELEDFRTEFRLAQDRRDQLLRQIDGAEADFGLGRPVSTSNATPVDAKIEEYRLKLEDLRLHFTDKHPDIVALESTIGRLEAQREAQQVPSAGTDFSNLDTNPVYQEMKIALSNAELDLTTVRGRLAAADRQVIELRRAVDTIPEVERQLARLNRDYSVTKAHYESMLQRLESARISEDAEHTSDEIKFRIIDPPIASMTPVAPNRHLFLTVVLGAAMGAGVALAFVLNQLSPVFNSRKTLQAISGFPVLGTVSLLQGSGQVTASRARAAAFALSTGMLVVAYWASMVFENQGMRLVRAVMTGDFL